MSSSYPGEEPRRDEPSDDAAQDVEHTQPVGYRPPSGADQPPADTWGSTPQPGQEQSYGQPSGQSYGQSYGQPQQYGQQDQYGQYGDAGQYGSAPSTGQPYGDQPYGGQPYGGQPYGAPAPGYGGYGPGSPYGAAAAPNHGQATTAMILGIVGLASIPILCGLGLFVSPVAWVLGRSSLKAIRSSGGRYGGEGQAKAGMVMGIIGTILLVLALVAIVALIGLAIGSSGETSYEYGDV